ncbi:hypothetical protein ACVWWO_006578 [Bradyrhizobium sp. F1.13.1]
MIRRFETGEHAQKRGLAAAAGPEQCKELAGFDVERHAVDGPERPERLGDALDAQQRLAGRELRLSNRSRSRICSGQLVSHGPCQPQSRRTLAADRPQLNRFGSSVHYSPVARMERQRNPGRSVSGETFPDCASLHPGYH